MSLLNKDDHELKELWKMVKPYRYGNKEDYSWPCRDLDLDPPDPKFSDLPLRGCELNRSVGHVYPTELEAEIRDGRRHYALTRSQGWRIAFFIYAFMAIFTDIADFGFEVLFNLPSIRSLPVLDLLLNLSVFLFAFIMFGPKKSILISSIEFIVIITYWTSMAYFQLITLIPFHIIALIIVSIGDRNNVERMKRNIEALAETEHFKNVGEVYQVMFPEHFKEDEENIYIKIERAIKATEK